MAEIREDLDLDFDDDLSFDDVSFDSQEPEDDRSPVTQMADNALDGVVSKATDADEIERTIRDKLPKSYATTVDFADERMQDLEKAKEALLSPIRKEMPQVKRNLNRLTPMVKKMVGDNLGDKFDELTKESSLGNVNYDQQEITQSLAGIFGTWREAQQEDRVQDTAQRLMSAQDEEGRFKLSYEQLTSIDTHMRKLTAYQDQVGMEVQSKQLELSYKKYHLLRNLLKVNTDAFGAQLTELKAITKNTGLPDLVKEQNSELFMQTLQEQWYGKSVDRVTDFGQQYFRKLTDNVVSRAKEWGESAADMLAGVGDFAGMYAEQQEQMAEFGEEDNRSTREKVFGIGANMFGSGVAGAAIDAGAEKLGDFLENNERARRMATQLDYFNRNRIQYLETFLAEQAEGEGRTAGLAQWLQEFLPTLEQDREDVRANLHERLSERAQWDNISRETLVTVIPGWLSKIHQAIRELKEEGAVAPEVYDLFSEQFVTQQEATTKAMQSLVSESDTENANELTNKLVDELFVGNEQLLKQLGVEGRRLMQELLVKMGRNNPEFNLDALGQVNNYQGLSSYNEDLAKQIGDAVQDAMQTSSSGRFKRDTGGMSNDRIARRNRLSDIFTQLTESLPNVQETLNQLDFSGNVDRLRQGGLLTNEGRIDHRALDEYILGRRTPGGDESASGGSQGPSGGPSGGPPPFMGGVGGGRGGNGPQPGPNGTDPRLWDYLGRMEDHLGRMAQFDTETGDVTMVDFAEEGQTKMGDILRRVLSEQEAPAVNYDPVTQRLDTSNTRLEEIKTLLATQLRVLAGEENTDGLIASLKGVSGNLKDLLSTPFTWASNVAGSAWSATTGFYGTLWGGAKSALGSAGKFGSGLLKGLMGSADIYIVGESAPALLGKKIDQGVYYNQDENGLDKDPIRSIDDIRGVVFDIEADRVVVTLEEYERGLETRTVGQAAQKVGGYAKSLFQLPMTLVNATTRGFYKTLGLAKDGLRSLKQSATNLMNRAVDLYDDQGNLLLTAKGFLKGEYYVMVDGELIVLRSLKDLMDNPGHIYRMDPASGEPVVLVEKETIARGLRTAQGQLVKVRNLFDGAMGLGRQGLNLLGTVAKAPITLMKKGSDWLARLLDTAVAKSTLLRLPDNVVMQTQTVHLYAGEQLIGSGESPKPSTDGPSVIEQVSDTVEKTMESVKGKSESLAEEAQAKYREFTQVAEDKLDEAKSFSERATAELSREIQEQRDDEDSKFNRMMNFFGEKQQETTDKMTETLKKVFEKPEVDGDADGDGYRDGSWQAKMAALKAKREKDPKDKPKAEKKAKAQEGDVLSKILAAVSGVGGILASILGGVGSTVSGMLGSLGLTKLAGMFGSSAATGAATSGGATAAANVTKAAAKKVAKKGATKLAARGAAAAGGALLGVGVAPLIMIAATLWTAYEVGDALYGYFDRRTSLGKYEYGRFLQYGYYTGNDGAYEDTKVALRYFESEMIGKIGTDKAGNGVIDMTPAEIWEEYATDLGGDPANVNERRDFVEWYGRRFKPVLFKWLSVIAQYRNEMNKDKHWWNSKELTLRGLDEELPEALAEDFVERVMDHSVLSFDPMEITQGASGTMPIQARRRDAQVYFDKFILKKEIVTLKEDKVVKLPKRPRSLAEVAKERQLREQREQRTKEAKKQENFGLGSGGYLRKSTPTAGKTAPPAAVKGNVHDIRDERVAQYADLITEASKRYGVDEELIKEVIKQESSGRADAVSRAGAVGLMQLMPGAAKDMKVSNRRDPRQNILGGTGYLSRQLKRFDGSVPLALAAYNAGGGNVNRAIDFLDGETDPDLVLGVLGNITGHHARETQDYVAKITAGYQRARPGVDLTKPMAGFEYKPDPNFRPATTQLAVVDGVSRQASKSRADAFLVEEVDLDAVAKATPSTVPTSTAPKTAPAPKMTPDQVVAQARRATPEGVKPDLTAPAAAPQPMMTQAELDALTRNQDERMSIARESLAIHRLQLAELQDINKVLQALQVVGNPTTPEPKRPPEPKPQLAQTTTPRMDRKMDTATLPIDQRRQIG